MQEDCSIALSCSPDGGEPTPSYTSALGGCCWEGPYLHTALHWVLCSEAHVPSVGSSVTLSDL